MEDIYSALYRTDLSSFIQKSFSIINPGIKYKHNWHIDAISAYLTAISNGDIKRLIINMPPRYLKSVIVSTAWPAWILGRSPNKRIMVASYSQILSTKHSLDTRLIINSNWYKTVFPNVKLSNDQNEKNKFSTTKQGFRFATSVGGTVTGEGGDFLILDDPHNPATIMSNLQRENTKSWFDQVWMSRLNDKKNGAMVLVMQRLHEDDLTGYITSNKSNWEILSLPAIFEKKKTIHINNYKKTSNKNSILHKEHEGKIELNIIKKDLGSYAFKAQYQQDPIKLNRGIINETWLKYYNIVPDKYIRIIQSWDTACKTDKNNDYSVCATIAETDSAFYILDIYRNKLKFQDLIKVVINKSLEYNPDSIIIEDKASGQSLIQSLDSDTKIPIIKYMPKDSKSIRLTRILPLFESGKVFIPKEKEWLDNFKEELLSFPLSRHDDQVDAISQAINWAINSKLNLTRIRLL